MRFRSSYLAVAFLCMVALSFAFLHLKSTCHQHQIPVQLTDLNSLLTLLNQWQRQAESQQEILSVTRVAAQLTQAIAAAQVARSLPPPARSPPPAVTNSSYASSEQEVFDALAIAGTQCHATLHTEHWGDPVVWGGTHHTRSAAECCAACQTHQATAARGGLSAGTNSTTCNVWVFCGDAARCGGRYRECWLKHLASLPPPDQPGSNSPWTSGAVYGGDAWLKPYEDRNTLTLVLGMGKVVVELLPSLAPGSVKELRRLAAMLGGGACDGCKLYRVETAFLVQGVISHPGGYVATPRRPNPPQRRVMERGLVCWAGGAGGPDFFVNLIDQSGFGDDHLCWGLIKDMTLMDAIVKLPIKPKAKANEMTFLKEELRFNLTLS